MSLDTTARTDGYRTRWTAHGYYYGGPVGVLAEYVLDREPVHFGAEQQVLSHQAWQLAASVAVTPGDAPSFKGLKPKAPFDPDKGTWGAVELAARYSELRVDEDTFDLGMATTSSAQRARSFTGGLNWHLSEIVKLQANYEHTTFDNRDAEYLIATRLAASI
jgi:phosphate-selective porin OprO/OprP